MSLPIQYRDWNKFSKIRRRHPFAVTKPPVDPRKQHYIKLAVLRKIKTEREVREEEERKKQLEEQEKNKMIIESSSDNKANNNDVNNTQTKDNKEEKPGDATQPGNNTSSKMEIEPSEASEAKTEDKIKMDVDNKSPAKNRLKKEDLPVIQPPPEPKAIKIDAMPNLRKLQKDREAREAREARERGNKLIYWFTENGELIQYLIQ